jgi:hypothetical protein
LSNHDYDDYDDYDALEQAAVDAWRKAALDKDRMKRSSLPRTR